MEYSLYLIWGRLHILGGQDPIWPPGSASALTRSGARGHCER